MCELCNAISNGEEIEDFVLSAAATEVITSPTGYPSVTSPEISPLFSDSAGILSPFSWGKVSSLTYGFSNGALDYYGGTTPNGEAAAFLPLSSAGKDMVRAAISAWDSISSLSFSETTGKSASIAIGGSSVPPTSWTYLPSGDFYDGDIWFGVDKGINKLFVATAPVNYIGSYEYFVALHEFGHALGLKHPQDSFSSSDVLLDPNEDSIEYTVMSYRSYIGQGGYAYTVRGDSYPQSLMMFDIAAIQTIYGADFTANSGNTVYSFSATTGEMLVNGAGTGVPGDNVVFRTVWDGGGVDTFDLSNYTTGMDVDLTPGAGIELDESGTGQRAWIGRMNATDIYASKNIYMSLLYNNDQRSLIENVITGSGNDKITGNGADNTITPNGGINTVDGGAGTDTVVLGLTSAAVTVSMAGSSLMASYAGGSVTLSNVEWLQTSDGKFQVDAVTGKLLSGASGSLAAVAAASASTPEVFAEFGSLASVKQNTVHVTLTHSFVNPVVFATVTSLNGGDIVVARVSNITAKGFDIRLQETSNLDDKHAYESVSYMVAEAGTWELADGRLMEVGKTTAGNLSSSGFQTVAYSTHIANASLFTTLQSPNDASYIYARTNAVGADSFDLALEREEARNYGSHAAETVGWLAIEDGISTVDGITLQTGSVNTTQAGATHNYGTSYASAGGALTNMTTFNGSDPAVIRVSSLGKTGIGVYIQEDLSRDGETAHATETIDILAIHGSGTMTGYDFFA